VTEIDPKLSRLYREASTEGPPAALDAAILAAARKQVERPQGRERLQRGERASLWSRWMVPASAIATLVLGVSIALLVEREQPGTSGDAAISRIPTRPQSPAPDRVPAAAEANTADNATASAAAKKEAPAAATTAQTPAAAATAQTPAAAAAAQAPAAELPARAPAAVAPVQVPAANAPAPVPRPDAPAPPAAEAFPAESRAKSRASGSVGQSNVAGDAAVGGPEAAAPVAPAVAAKRSPPRQQAAGRSPEAWLDEISRLKRDGREKEAAAQMAEFRKAYPAYAVPDALRGLE